MKKEYMSPELEIVTISAEDIITTSTLGDGGEGSGGSTGWGDSTIING